MIIWGIVTGLLKRLEEWCLHMIWRGDTDKHGSTNPAIEYISFDVVLLCHYPYKDAKCSFLK